MPPACRLKLLDMPGARGALGSASRCRWMFASSRPPTATGKCMDGAVRRLVLPTQRCHALPAHAGGAEISTLLASFLAKLAANTDRAQLGLPQKH
jgi:hypothetical protein